MNRARHMDRACRALGVDPTGRFFVVEGGSASVVRLAPEGIRETAFGGPGTGDYGLLDPADVEPSVGLDLFIADAGNHRIQRVSRDGRLLETIPVPDGARATEGDLDGRDALSAGAESLGRPVAVAVGPEQALYAVEAGRGVVHRWGAGRRLAGALGADGEGALREPVSLAVGPGGALAVADRARRAVQLFDAYGSPLRAVPAAAVGEVVAVATAPGPRGPRLLVVGPRAVAVHEWAGGRVELIGLAPPEPLLDAAVAGGTLYVLTAGALWRVAR